MSRHGKYLLEIVNPKPDAKGNIHTRIGLEHAHRHIKRDRAFRINENGEPDPEGAFLVFTDRRERNGSGRIDVDALLRRIGWGPSLPYRVKTAAEQATDQRAVDLWPVIPRHSGRPLEDFLATQERRTDAEGEVTQNADRNR